MTGNKTFDNLLIALLFLATGAALGTFVYTEMVYKRPLPKDDVELAKLKSDTKGVSTPESYKLDKLTVNLTSKTRRLRFLDVQMHIVVFKKSDISKLEEIKPIINDIIIDVASGMEPDELNSIAGKLIFENRVKKNINEHLKKVVVKELFYTKFVVQ
jgi:flagellar FliL protein